ncbi:MAG TPA: tail fiber protein [Candidatus Limnocylindria bacterium]|jgi:microcystin-dependent protein|nr:tail fiber protein [Candidatus Limnocylindria bacterium]
MTAYLGLVLPVAFGFAPKGWNLCQGQLLSISQNQALFSLLGTFYGGNGTTTFALPELRGRAAVGYGSGAGLPPVEIGQSAGSSTVTLLPSNLPPHNHMIKCGAAGTTAVGVGGFLANSTDPNGGTLKSDISDPAQATAILNPAALAVAGASVPLNLMPPYLAINYVICMSGIFPSRN